jgi:hypothetical protein
LFYYYLFIVINSHTFFQPPPHDDPDDNPGRIRIPLSNKTPLFEKLEAAKLVFPINITAGLTTPIWNQIHTQVHAHLAQQPGFVLEGFNFHSPTPHQYDTAFWQVLHPGHRRHMVQYLNPSADLTSYSITRTSLNAIMWLLKHPYTAKLLLCLCNVFAIFF